MIERGRAWEAIQALRACWLDEYGDEKGAQRWRVDAKRIKGECGAAMRYVIAYISKNIDGDDAMPSDFIDHETGVSGVEGAKRAQMWARLWGIRQFQFFGTPSVGVWRELRRCAADAESAAMLERVRDLAADQYPTVARAAAGVLVGDDEPLREGAARAMGCADTLAMLLELQKVARGFAGSPVALFGEAFKAADRGEYGQFLSTQQVEPIALVKADYVNAYGETVAKVVGVASSRGRMITHQEGWAIRWGAKQEAEGIEQIRVPAPAALSPDRVADVVGAGGVGRAGAKRPTLGLVSITVTGDGNLPPSEAERETVASRMADALAMPMPAKRFSFCETPEYRAEVVERAENAALARDLVARDAGRWWASDEYRRYRQRCASRWL
ncbi:hypothetical protein ACTSKR_09565 [Chitinibacteraceae bacterium HSL-7]